MKRFFDELASIGTPISEDEPIDHIIVGSVPVRGISCIPHCLGRCVDLPESR
jgi:hypothetical protein